MGRARIYPALETPGYHQPSLRDEIRTMETSEAECCLCAGLQEQLQAYGRAMVVLQRLKSPAALDAALLSAAIKALLHEVRTAETKLLLSPSAWMAQGTPSSPRAQALLVRVQVAIERVQKELADLENTVSSHLGNLNRDIDNSVRALKMHQAYVGGRLPA